MTAPTAMASNARPAAPPGPARAAGSARAAEAVRAAGSVAALDEAGGVVASMSRLGSLAGDAATWPSRERRSVLQQLDRAVDGLVAVRAVVLLAEREAGTWRGSGDRSFEAWRGRTARTGERSAAAQVRQADQLAAAPAVAAAVTEGRIRLDHAAAIATVAASGTAAQQQAARDPIAQADLLGAAERLDAGTFATTVARWAAGIDPEALERDHQAQRAERFLHLTPTSRGTFLKGRLDSMAGHRLTLALEALSPRPALDDDRDPGQRRADALDALAGRVLALADTKPGGHVPPQISMILTAETWAAARAARDRRRALGDYRRAPQRRTTGDPVPGSSAAQAGDVAVSGFRAADPGRPTDAADDDDDGRLGRGVEITGPDVAPRAVGYPPATLEDGTPIPASEVAAALCDGAVTRIVLDADGVPLDLGRTLRLFTGEQRRAVIARDRGCVWPGCQAHARWCEVHHLDWWERDAGPTSVENGALLCSYHHHEVHRRDLTITRLVAPVGDPPARGRGAPRREGAPGRLIRVQYTVRDRSGRIVGEPSNGRQSPNTDRLSTQVTRAGPAPPGRHAPQVR